LDTRGETSARYYQYRDDYLNLSYRGSVGISRQFSTRTNVSVGQSIGYSPTFYFLQRLLAVSGLAAPGSSSLLPEGEASTSLDYSSSDSRAYTYETNARVSHDVSRRGVVSLSGSYRYTDLAANVENPLVDLTAYEAGGAFRYGLAPGAGLRLGYTYRKGDHGYGYLPARNAAVAHDIDVGIDYDRGLSLSRRTRLTFSTGSSLLRTPVQGLTVEGNPEDPSQTQNQNRFHYLFLGGATLSHGFGRTWSLAADYSRRVTFVEGINAPVYGDRLTLSSRGLANRRVQLGVSASYSTGETVTVTTAPAFTTYSGAARAFFAVNRTWALSLEYVYYYYDFTATETLAAGLPRKLERNSVRAGLAMRVPFIGR
jgi:hypothetical protein